MRIYNSSSYRHFIETYIAEQPRAGWGFVGRLAKMVGVSSTQFSQILKGKKNLTLEQAFRLAKGILLSDEETEYFLALVEKDRAGSVELRQHLRAKTERMAAAATDLKKLIAPSKELSEEQRAVFYSDWRYSAVRLFCSIEPGQNLNEIRDYFGFTNERTKVIVEFLLQAGLCVHGSGDKIKMGPQRTFVSTGTAPFYQHHANWRLLAMDRAKEPKSKNEIFFTSPVSMSTNDFDEFSLRLKELIKEFSEKVRESPSEIVGCLEIDYFRLK